VASELKAIEGHKNTTFPPGHYMTSKDGEFAMVKREWTDYDAVKDNETSIPVIKEALKLHHPHPSWGRSIRSIGCEEKTSVT
jgi:asparagine synthase (glutamine-hydrolysing)